MDPRDFLFAFILFQVSFDGRVSGHRLHRTSKFMSCHQPCSQKESDRDYPKPLCSCTESCVRYGDCCYDSPWKNEGRMIRNLLCLPVEGLGFVSVVNSCPRGSSKGSAAACERGLSRGLPVTSLSTGTSYINIHCALCNEDADDLKGWSVDFKCCSEYTKQVSTESHFVYTYRQKLWSMSILRNGTRMFCECKLFLRHEDRDFMDTLELRNCHRKEISTCSFSWKIESVKQYCNAYLDPIYSRDKMYRNKFCAICNYENDEQLKCTPEYQNIISSYGLSHEEAYKYCNAYGLEACLVLLNRDKGRAYSFSKIFSIEQVGCIPPEGRVCCKGERWDFKSTKCRKVLTNG